MGNRKRGRTPQPPDLHAGDEEDKEHEPGGPEEGEGSGDANRPPLPPPPAVNAPPIPPVPPPPPAERTPDRHRIAVDYPIFVCPHCASRDTHVLPNQERENHPTWRLRQCGNCNRKFKEAVIRGQASAQAKA